MNNHAPVDLTEQVSAAFDWWREAGVECHFHEAPANWLASAGSPPPAAEDAYRQAMPEPRPDREVPAPGSGSDPAIDRSNMPDSLPGFHAWWLAEPTLDHGRTTGRVPPRGTAKPELMVLVPEPERDDADILLAGAEGRLLSAMLQAMGIAPDALYLASALPRHTPLADWATLRSQGLDAIVAHHVALVRPKRLIVFGNNVLPLLGHDPAQETDVSRRFNHGGVSVPLLTARSLAAMLERPRWKAVFWKGWLDWTSRATSKL